MTFSYSLFCINAIFISFASSQCPTTIRAPCSCATTRYEPVSVTCEGAGSLTVVLQAMGKPTVPIDSLLIINSPIRRLPAYAFQGYSVKRLVLRNNSLSEIDTEAFDGPLTNSLEELEIRNNLLTEIPRTGTTKLQSLITLILAKNNIHSLNSSIFTTYQSKHILRKLDLSANQLKVVLPQAFEGLASIQEINFDKNFLTSIPTESLKQLTSLEDLSLGVNQIETIPNGALIFPNLKSLSLEVNQISRINAESLQGVPNLLYLYLSANNFRDLDGEMFRFTPNLKVLAMGNNNITKISSKSFQFIPGLVRLELSECKIETVEPGAFQTTSKIQVVVLNKNRIQIITRNMFQGLSELYSLDLKGNNISIVEDRAWSKLPSLRHLDISSNKITHLGTATFAGTFEKSNPLTTRILYIYDNLWICDEKLEWFRKWLHDNSDMIIDAPGYSPSVCNKPEILIGTQIRLGNVTSGIAPTIVIAKNSLTPKTVIKTKDNLHEPLQGDHDAAPKISGVNIMALILGIVLGVFLITLVLLMITRYFVSKSRRDNKAEDEDVRRFGNTSSLSGYQSAAGSVFPSPPLPMNHQQHARAQYYLSRPWYWWF